MERPSHLLLLCEPHQRRPRPVRERVVLDVLFVCALFPAWILWRTYFLPTLFSTQLFEQVVPLLFLLLRIQFQLWFRPCSISGPFQIGKAFGTFPNLLPTLDIHFLRKFLLDYLYVVLSFQLDIFVHNQLYLLLLHIQVFLVEKLIKVFMSNCLLCGQSLLWVKIQKLGDQVDCILILTGGE